MAQSDTSPVSLFTRVLVLARRFLAVRMALIKAEAASRFNSILLAVAIALVAAVLIVLALVFALLAVAAGLQTMAGLSPGLAYAAVAGGSVVTALLLGLMARSYFRRALTSRRPPRPRNPI